VPVPRFSVKPEPEMHDHFVGSSPVFQSWLRQLSRVAASSAPVLIEGETGSGKELAARAIHYRGERAAGPFVAVNCGALPDYLVEAELFGHERGAFTDAKAARRGLVAQADGGTLFLDEVDTLSPKAQVTLLRFLQDQRYRPLGSSRELVVDVRLIAATNQVLDDAVQHSRFRADLLYRLRILHLRIPSLRERGGDAEQLARHFVGVYCAKYGFPPKVFDEESLAFIRRHRWPGNVRELESWVHRELLMADGLLMRPAGQRSTEAGALLDAAGALESFCDAKAEAVRCFERAYVISALRQAEGNVTRAARLAGKERRAFGKLLKKHGIDRQVLSG